MDIQSTLQAIMDNIVWLLLVLLGGLVMTYLRGKSQKLAAQVLYGLAGSVLVAILIISVRYWMTLPDSAPLVTSDNVESRVREWADQKGMRIESIRDDPSAPLFHLQLQEPIAGRFISVIRTKDEQRYIYFAANLAATAEENAVLSKAPQDHTTAIRRHVSTELAKLGIKGMGFYGDPLSSIRIHKKVLIEGGLNEEVFEESIVDIQRALAVAGSSYYDYAPLSAIQNDKKTNSK